MWIFIFLAALPQICRLEHFFDGAFVKELDPPKIGFDFSATAGPTAVLPQARPQCYRRPDRSVTAGPTAVLPQARPTGSTAGLTAVLPQARLHVDLRFFWRRCPKFAVWKTFLMERL